MYKNILVIGHSNIGDVCYDLAVIDPLSKAFPGSRISFITSSVSIGLVRGYPGIDSIITFDRHSKDKGFLGRLRFTRMLQRQKFDLVVVLCATYMQVFLGSADAWCVKKRSRVDKVAGPRHVVDVYLALLKANGVDVPGPVFNFNFTPEENRFADDFVRDNKISSGDVLIGILPLSNWSLKCWYVENWNKLSKALAAAHKAKIIVFGKSSNDPYVREAVAKISPELISAIDKTTLRQSLALIKRCGLFISADTSFLHFASCLGVPCIGLFGATAETHYYPYFSRDGIIKSPEPLWCMPCGGSRHFAVCKAKDGLAPCMEAITVDAVLDRAGKLLKKV